MANQQARLDFWARRGDIKVFVGSEYFRIHFCSHTASRLCMWNISQSSYAGLGILFLLLVFEDITLKLLGQLERCSDWNGPIFAICASQSGTWIFHFFLLAGASQPRASQLFTTQSIWIRGAPGRKVSLWIISGRCLQTTGSSSFHSILPGSDHRTPYALQGKASQPCQKPVLVWGEVEFGVVANPEFWLTV